MKILLIGGTGFIGSHVTRVLVEQRHRITIYHRNQSNLPLPDSVEHVIGERGQIAEHEQELRRLAPDVVVDCILSNGGQARVVVNLFRGIAARFVALSSGDVYRAAGILHGFESGSLQPTPLREDSDLRTKQNVYGPELLTRLRQVFPWLDDEYDKIPVEQAVLGDPELPGTVLRLPMVYGPGDSLHRLFPYLKRMDDNRPAILLQEDVASWHGPRGYVENVAAAIALATVSHQAAGRIYNVAEPCAWSEEEWVKKLAQNVGWTGHIKKIPEGSMPTHLRIPYRNDQHWDMSSRRIREELGFSEPFRGDAALARTIDWERSHPPGFVPQQFDYAAEDEALAMLGLGLAPSIT
jgi:nucleoside-diphosphate-sugar epimerase